MRLHHARDFGEDTFILAEKLDNYRSAQLAAAEYRAEGWLCRVEPVALKESTNHYRIWVGRERKVKVRTLPGEVIKRRKASRILAAS